MAGITELVSDDEVVVETSPFELLAMHKTPQCQQAKGNKVTNASKESMLVQPSIKLLLCNSAAASLELKVEDSWVENQSRDRAKLLCLSSEKRELRLRTLQTTFDRIALADQEKLTELSSLVSRMKAKI